MRRIELSASALDWLMLANERLDLRVRRETTVIQTSGERRDRARETHTRPAAAERETIIGTHYGVAVRAINSRRVFSMAGADQSMLPTTA